MTTSPLLNLPPELRNRIFKFVLTSDEPLACALVVTDSDVVTPKLVDSREQHAGFGGQNRNYSRKYRISDGQLLNKSSKKRLHTLCNLVSFNQLQFVNRQIRKETKGLALKYNTINLTNHDEDALEELQCLHGALSPGRVPWLGRVQLTWRGEARKDRLQRIYPHQILKFCKEYPHVHVQIVLPQWKPRRMGEQRWDDNDAMVNPMELEDFFEIGIHLSMQLRNDKSMFHEIMTRTITEGVTSDKDLMQILCSKLSLKVCDQVQGVTNILFKPGFEFNNNEIPGNWYYEEFPMACFSKKQQMRWMKWIKLWTKEGIRPNI